MVDQMLPAGYYQVYWYHVIAARPMLMMHEEKKEKLSYLFSTVLGNG